MQAIEDKFDRDDRFMELVTPNRYHVHDGLMKKKFSKVGGTVCVACFCVPPSA